MCVLLLSSIAVLGHAADTVPVRLCVVLGANNHTDRWNTGADCCSDSVAYFVAYSVAYS